VHGSSSRKVFLDLPLSQDVFDHGIGHMVGAWLPETAFSQAPGGQSLSGAVGHLWSLPESNIDLWLCSYDLCKGLL
jgi:hypothetical protein